MTWESVGEINLGPLEWGWELNENLLVPVMTDLDPEPSDLRQFVRCKCKTENRRPKTICS